MYQMKNLIILTCLLLVSCSNDDNSGSLVPDPALEGNWKLVSIMEKDDEFIPESDYILEFTSDSTFSINLAVNKTGWFFALSNFTQIDSIRLSGGTELCCDTDFDKIILRLMPEMESMTISNDQLLFENTESKILFVKAK